MAGATSKIKDFLGWGSDSDVEDYEGVVYSDSPASTRSSQVAQQPTVSAIHSITTIHPRSFNDAVAIGEAYRDGLTTIVNVASLPDSDARRIVDFASGLVLGLRGSIERVDTKVFLLTPAEIEIVSDGPASTNAATGFLNVG